MTTATYNSSNTQNAPQLKSLVGPDLGPPPTIHIFAVALTYTNPTTPGEQPLKDPVQDIEHIRTQLSEFDCVRFTTLYESAASRDNILLNLKDKLPKCHPGDLFVLYLAGHSYSDVGYEFVTYYEHKTERAKARLSYRDILEYVQKYCPSGVQVLQVRDTCFASPDAQEAQMLVRKDGSVMVLAACAVDQLSYEKSPVPHSLFLRRLVCAAETFKDQVSTAPDDPSTSIATFFRTILLPIQVLGRPQQDPQLAPCQSQPEFISFLARLIRELQNDVSD
ncbi:hypothetical protein FRC08_011703 [Ceratobasidium sp. 394]|nr:hypothetical protein FRC08_011703 [Ceratobasidium sp. 394]